MHPIQKSELLHVQIALLLAIILQVSISPKLIYGPPYVIAALELGLVFAIGFTAQRRHTNASSVHRTLSILLLGIITVVNAISLVLLVYELIHGSTIPGKNLLYAALAIYVTNIISFGIWYWEIDSPGLTGKVHHRHHTHFLFTQNREAAPEKQKWQPKFFDYLYTSLTNATNFSPSDTSPLSHQAKSMMGIQCLIALVTVVLVTARAVTALG